MADPIVPNVVVSMPSQLFTLARSLKAAANGKIYIGKIDTDPTIPENQIQVYIQNEDDSLVPIAQPIVINAGGYPVYSGQISKFVTVEGHSMAVYDAYNVQQFYFPNVLKYDPDQLRRALSQSDGAALIGYMDAVTGLTNVKEKLDRIPPRATDYPSIEAYLNSGVKSATIPAGVYPMQSLTLTNSDLSVIKGEGPDTVLDFSSSTDGLKILGDLAEILAPTTIGNVGSNTITFPSSVSLAKGDVIVLWNSTSYSLNQYRDYYRDGFMFQVASYSGNVAKIYGTIPVANLSTVRAFKITGGSISIQDIRIIPPNAPTCMQIFGRVGVSISGLHVDDGTADSSVFIDRCFDVSVDSSSSYASQGNAYPIVLGNVQNFTIGNFTGNSIRHSIALGGAAGNGTVPTRDGVVHNCILKNESSGGVLAADAHGNCINISYNNCILDSGGVLGGADISYRNCTVRSRVSPNDGLSFYGSEVFGGEINISDCVIELPTITDIPSFSVNNVFASALWRNLSVNVSNVSLTFRGASAAISLKRLVEVYVAASADGKRCAINVDGVSITSTSDVTFQSLVGFNRTADVPTTANLFVSVANVKSPFIGPWSTNFAELATQTKFKLPESVASATIVTQVGGANTTTGLAAFRNPYPKVPIVIAALNSMPGLGGRETLMSAYSVTLTDATLRGAALGGNYTAANLLSVFCRAVLSEF